MDNFAQYAPEIEQALLIRRTEQRLLALFNQGKLFGTVHTSIGQEFSAVAVGRVLELGDSVFSNHRCHGHYLAYGGPLAGLVAEVMGRSTGVCGGRGGSQHLHYGRFFSNGVLGGTAPLAAGFAYSHKLAQDGGVTVIFLGDGAFGEGVVYESLNIAARWELPVLFVCEDNHYAQSTHQEQTLAGGLADRAAAFGLPVYKSSTHDWPALFASTEKSLSRVRRTGSPVFQYVDTHRLMAHSKGDDNRPKDEIDAIWAADPLVRIMDQHGSDPAMVEILARVDAAIDEAVRQSEESGFADLQDSAAVDPARPIQWRPAAFPPERAFLSIQKGLANALSQDSQVHLIGEDIESPYGGAFKCTDGLSLEFPGRVRNTPISEAAIVGIGTGMAMAGLRPIVEIMFGDFMALTLDQWLNHAAKFGWMYNDGVQVPLILRTPMGGRRGYGATHSQSLEKHFLGVPGTRVLAMHTRILPSNLYAQLVGQVERPILVLENKVLYGQNITADPPSGYSLQMGEGPFPMMRLKPDEAADITMVAIGGVSIEAEKALSQLYDEEIYVDLFLPTQLYPLDIAPLAGSLERTRRLLVVEEGQGFVSLSAEILAQALEWQAGRPILARRLTAAAHPIPSSRPLEQASLPQVEDIFHAALDLFETGHGDS